MNKALMLAAAFAASATLSSFALEVNVNPGKLSSQITDPAGVTTLTLRGGINAADMLFIAGSMNSLTTLDMADVEIAAYTGDALDGRSAYPASTIPDGVFAGMKISSLTLPANNPVNIGAGAFAGTAITSLTLPSGTGTVGTGAFSSCTALKTVIIPLTATLESHVFAHDTSLSSVNLCGAATLPDAIFDGCTSLATVDGVQNLTSIGARAFAECKALDKFTFSTTMREIGAEAFAFTSIASADLAECENLMSVGAWAFACNPALTSVSLPSEVKSVGKGAFFDCTSLSAFELPDKTTTLAAYVLKGDSGIADTAMIHSGVDSIGAYAMKDLSAVETIALPATLTYVGDGAMEGMTGLKTIYATELVSVPETGADVWSGVDRPSVVLHLADYAADEFRAADQWQDFNIVSISTGVEDAIVAPEASSAVSGRFDGSELCLLSRGSAIASVAVYDPAGRLLISASGNGGETFSTDTSAFTTGLFVVECVLEDGTRGVLKMKR